MREYREELQELAEEENIAIPEWVGEDEAEKIIAVYEQDMDYLIHTGFKDALENAIRLVREGKVDFERLGGSPVGEWVATYEIGTTGFGKLQDKIGYHCHEFDVYDSGDVVGHLDVTAYDSTPVESDYDWLYCYANANERKHWIVVAGEDE